MSELKRLFQQAVNRHEQDTLFPALLGYGDGSTLYTEIPGFVWARVTKPTGATVTQVRCRQLTPVYDAPVRVREDPIDKVLEVVREDATQAIAFFDGQSNIAGLHAGQHGYYGSDPLRLDARQYMPLLVHPTDPPSMSVVIEPLAYTFAGNSEDWGGGQLDLTSYVPASTDEQTCLIIGIDKATNTPAVAVGDTVTETNNNIQYVPFTRSQVAGVARPDDFMPSMAVRLYNGMVNIQHWDCFEDVRDWLSGGDGGGMTSFIVAGDSGSPQTIEDGDTLSILGGTGLSSVASATDTLTMNLDNTAVTPGSYTYSSLTVDAQGRLTAASSGAAPGTMSSFNVDGDTGTPQTITDGNTLEIAGGIGIATVAGATDTLTINLNIPELTAETVADNADLLAIYDDSAAAHRKMTRANFLSGIMASFDVDGDSGPAQTISNGNTLLILGGNGIDTVASATDTLTVSQQPEAVNGFRLSATTAVPVTTTDVTGATTVRCIPYKGNAIQLYDGASDVILNSAEVNLSVAAFTNPYQIVDIYAYPNSGTLTLEGTAWNAPPNGAITGATNATPISITSTAHGLATNDIVTINGVGGNTAANGTFRVTNTGANTFTLQNFAGASVAGSGAYTSGGNWYKANYAGTRATALDYFNGYLIKSGDSTRRFIGTVEMNATGAQFDDALLFRGLSNYYNTVYRIAKKAGVAVHNYNTAAWRWFNNDAQWRVQGVTCLDESGLRIKVQGLMSLDNPLMSAGYNASNSAVIRQVEMSGTAALGAAVTERYYGGIGNWVINLIEFTGSGNPNYFYGQLEVEALG